MGTILLWKLDDGSTAFAVFDVVTSESHEGLVEVSEHPVEEGPNVSDHARPAADRITLEAFISNTPLWSNLSIKEIRDLGYEYQVVKLDIPEKPNTFTPTPGGLTRAAVNAVNNLFNPPPDKATILKASSPRNRVRETYAKLEDARINHRLVRVESSLREYENMLIERINIPRAPEDGSGGVFQIDLKRVRIVQSESVEAPQPTEVRGATSQAKGSKAPKDAAKATEKKKSIAAGLFDGAKGGLSGLFE